MGMTEQERAAWIEELAKTVWDASEEWAVLECAGAWGVQAWPPDDAGVCDLTRYQAAAIEAKVVERKVAPLTDALEQVRAYLVDGDVGEARALIERTLARGGVRG